jgi:hypothetical protein
MNLGYPASSSVFFKASPIATSVSCQNHFSAKNLQQFTALDTHRFRHGQYRALYYSPLKNFKVVIKDFIVIM